MNIRFASLLTRARSTVLAIFGAQATILCLLVRDVAMGRTGFPNWFSVAVVTASLALLLLIAVFAVEVATRWNNENAPSKAVVSALWAGGILCVFATTAVHGFYPFRFAVFAHWHSMPWVFTGNGSRLKFNWLFSALALTTTATFAATYAGSHRALASLGILVVAALLLWPNDNCANGFNRSWNASVGASPLMFLPASFALLVVLAGLRGIWPRFGLTIVFALSGVLLLLGLGHATHVAW